MIKGRYHEILRNIIVDTNDASNNDAIVDPDENYDDEIEAMLKEKCPVIYLSQFH